MVLTYIRPDADDTDGTWTNESDSASNLYQSIDETVASDTDYIKSVHLPDHDICKIRLSDPSGMVMRPATVHYRFKKRGETTQQINLDVSLLQGSTEIAKWTETDIATSYVDGSQTLTLAQFNSISDFNNLYLQFDASSSWWLAASEVDLWFEDNLYHLSTALSSAHLLLHCDGADTSTTFIDATGRHQVSVTGNAQIDTAQSKFGGASGLFDGTGDYLTLDGSSDFTFGTGDFTIDCWIRPTTSLTGVKTIIDFRPGANGFYTDLRLSGGQIFLLVNSANVISGSTLSLDTWYHVALTRSGTSTKLFLNGTQDGSTYTDSNNYLSTTGPIIGEDAVGGSGAFQGWIDEVRVLKGTAAWTTTFTPPTAPYNVALSGPYAHLSISRASIGYAKTSSGTLTQFAANALRITDLGLLVEDARTNLILYSQDSTQWATNNVTLTANTTVAPDGTTTANTMVEAAGFNTHNAWQSGGAAVTVASNTTHTLSVYVKASGRNYCSITGTIGGANWFAAVFDLLNGVIGETQIGGAGVLNSSSIEAMGSGWYRCIVSGSIMGGSTGMYAIVGATTAATGNSFAGSGEIQYTGTASLNAVILWGRQVETAAFPSSYVPTSGAAATRAADAVSTVGNLLTVLTSDNASVVVDYKKTGTSTGSYEPLIGQLNSGLADLEVKDVTGFPEIQAQINNDNAHSVQTASVTLAAGLQGGVKAGSSWNMASGMSVVIYGDTVATAAYTVPNNVSTPRIGLKSTTSFSFGYFRRLTLWASKLADADLQTMTDPAHTINFTTDEASIDLDFANAAYNAIALPYDFLIISRASVGYAQTVAGTLQLFGANQLRITDKGLLVEDARTNNCLQSQDFTTTWSGASITVGTGIAAPDGTSTANSLTATGSDVGISQNCAATAGLTYTASIWMKVPSSTTTINFYMIDTGSSFTSCNLTTSWQRFSVTRTIAGGGTTFFQIGGASTFNSPTVVHVWGAQIEQGSFPSSYIATTSGSQTRAADAVDCTASLATVLQALPHSACVDFTLSDSSWATTNSRLIGSSTVGNQAVLYIPTNTQVGTYNGSSTLDATIGSSGTNSAGTKSAAGQSSGARSVVAGGGTVASDANAGLGMSNACLGRTTSGSPTYGYFRRVTVWTSKLADATLQGFTNP